MGSKEISQGEPTNSTKKTKKKNTKMLIDEFGELNKHMGKQHFQKLQLKPVKVLFITSKKTWIRLLLKYSQTLPLNLKPEM